MSSFSLKFHLGEKSHSEISPGKLIQGTRAEGILKKDIEDRQAGRCTSPLGVRHQAGPRQGMSPAGGPRVAHCATWGAPTIQTVEKESTVGVGLQHESGWGRKHVRDRQDRGRGRSTWQRAVTSFASVLDSPRSRG